ncbi:hypothetical protein IJJ27_00380 [bacterium]|nr:hypothetical protein [bacterium]MBQ6436004.1 hypothetical protein [bacterium]
MLKITIKLDQKQDISEFKHFWRTKNQTVIQAFPHIKKESEIEDLIEECYQNDPLLKNKVQWLKKSLPDLQAIANHLSVITNESWDHINEITIYPSVCPICPRFLETNSFMVNYRFYRPDVLAVCAHEMTHFLYFKQLENALGHSINKEYPSQDWMLSEIVIPCIVNHESIKEYVGYDQDVFGVDLDNQTIHAIQKLWRGDVLNYRNAGLKKLNSIN